MEDPDVPPAPSQPRELPVRVFRLGQEPRESLAGVTTAEQRLAMVWQLTRRMWILTGRPFPACSRENLPGRVLRSP